MYNGEEIKHLLLKQNKSKTELSKAVTGRSNSSLHHIYKNPTAATLEKIADFFGVSIDTLFNHLIARTRTWIMRRRRMQRMDT